jgi:dihydroorotate dehydrogenase (fumarate)
LRTTWRLFLAVDRIVKYLLVGADAVMTTAALLRHGLEHMAALVSGLEQWLEVREIDGVRTIRGRMRRGVIADSTAFDRANYLDILHRHEFRPDTE